MARLYRLKKHFNIPCLQVWMHWQLTIASLSALVVIPVLLMYTGSVAVMLNASMKGVGEHMLSLGTVWFGVLLALTLSILSDLGWMWWQRWTCPTVVDVLQHLQCYRYDVATDQHPTNFTYSGKTMLYRGFGGEVSSCVEHSAYKHVHLFDQSC